MNKVIFVLSDALLYDIAVAGMGHLGEIDDDSLLIQHGRFFAQDNYPDIELFASAAMLLCKFTPDDLLVHVMGMDYMGEKYGTDSSEYRNRAILQNMWMIQLIAQGVERGYRVFVTCDPGMNADKLHRSATPDVHEVPLYLIRPNIAGKGDTQEMVSHLQLAPTRQYASWLRWKFPKRVKRPH